MIVKRKQAPNFKCVVALIQKNIRTKGMVEILTVKHKGLCLFVIHFTLLIYHESDQFDYMFVCYFTILSKILSFLNGQRHIYSLTILFWEVDKVKRYYLLFLLIFFMFSFLLNLLGLLHLMPLYVTSPLMFISLFSIILFINERKRFRGFQL